MNNKWFALGGDGEIYYLGYCEDFNHADERADELLREANGAVWLFDENTAREMVEALNENLD